MTEPDRLVIPSPDKRYVSDRYVYHIADKEAPHGYGELANEPYINMRDIRNEQLLCSHPGSSWNSTEGGITLREAADMLGFDKTEFSGKAPDQICSLCWEKASDRAAKLTDKSRQTRDYGRTGYRMRWKQKGRAAEEWYDIVVQPSTTFAELDTLLTRFSTINGLHVRMYGYEDEYMDSTPEIYPDKHYEKAMLMGTEQRASNVTIADVARNVFLGIGDGLTMVSDLATPVKYYCLVKEVASAEQLKTQLAEIPTIHETDTAAIVRARLPDSGIVVADRSYFQ